MAEWKNVIKILGYGRRKLIECALGGREKSYAMSLQDWGKVRQIT